MSKNISRRKFLKLTAGAGVAAAASGLLPWKFAARDAYAFYQSSNIPLFGTTLRGAGPGGIPVAMPGVLKAPVTGVTNYIIGIGQFQDHGVCPTLGPTTLWGYLPSRGLGNYIKPTHLSGLIIAKGSSPGVPGDAPQPIQIEFQNLLYVKKPIIPVDTTIPGANQAINRTAVHMHGGLVPWISDGGPFDWFDPYGKHGLSFLNNKVLNPLFGLPGSAAYYYPMNQSARFLWYHDHAFGITRTNAYSGIASGVLVRDGFEANLINAGLPNYVEAGGCEIPLIFQDKIFVGPDINAKDPLWSSLVQKEATHPGSLWYAHTYEANNPLTGSGRWDLGPGIPPPDPSCIPEFFGDTMLVNGTVFPQAAVQARRYRLRLLNACNARFLNLQLYVADNSPNGITLDATGAPTNTPFINNATGDASFLQIGTEGGFLANPAKIPSNVPFTITDPNFASTGNLDPSQMLKSLVVSPAERPDVIVDFAGYEGQNIILYNDAPAPFPGGDDRNDYFPGWNVGTGLFGVGNPVNGTTPNGFGPNTRILMRFSVGPVTGSGDIPLSINPGTNLSQGIDPTLLPTWGWTDDTVLPWQKRFLTLNEAFDAYGRLIQTLGNAGAPNGAAYTDAPTEVVNNGATEVWEIYNNTGDVHPIHFHLVNVQVINRQMYSSYGAFTGPVIPPAANENGWRETVSMYPGTVTRVIMKFELPQIVTAKGKVIPTPPSPRTGGNEFVWHCHILEHEEHDMMRPLVVI
jgi:spore coat protein A, manganese oxidase